MSCIGIIYKYGCKPINRILDAYTRKMNVIKLIQNSESMFNISMVGINVTMNAFCNELKQPKENSGLAYMEC